MTKITRRDAVKTIATCAVLLPSASIIADRPLPGKPDLSRVPFSTMAWENEDGSKRHYIDFSNSDPLSSSPNVEEYPNAVCIDVDVRTTHYSRRKSDGLYGGKDEILTCNSSFWDELVLGLVSVKGYRLKHAIIIASEACEGCMNVLAHDVGVGGYPFHSPQHIAANTSCRLCKK